MLKATDNKISQGKMTVWYKTIYDIVETEENYKYRIEPTSQHGNNTAYKNTQSNIHDAAYREGREEAMAQQRVAQ